jgi:hypothetical protein
MMGFAAESVMFPTLGAIFIPHRCFTHDEDAIAGASSSKARRANALTRISLHDLQIHRGEPPGPHDFFVSAKVVAMSPTRVDS